MDELIFVTDNGVLIIRQIWNYVGTLRSAIVIKINISIIECLLILRYSINFLNLHSAKHFLVCYFNQFLKARVTTNDNNY